MNNAASADSVKLTRYATGVVAEPSSTGGTDAAMNSHPTDSASPAVVKTRIADATSWMPLPRLVMNVAGSNSRSVRPGMAVPSTAELVMTPASEPSLTHDVSEVTRT